MRQLLLFSRKMGTERMPLDLNAEVEQALDILKSGIPKMIEVEFKPDEKLWVIDADPVQVEQIILNMGGNAADAMPDGGRLTIETANVTLDEQYAQNQFEARPGRYVRLTVADTGHGMDPSTVEHIFEPFFTTKEIGKGTGLGLASVYGIVKSHDGYIRCQSEPGRGAIFHVFLPAVQEVRPSLTEDLGAALPRGGEETVLLVDDEESIINLAKHALTKFGYSVLTASCGEDALEIFGQNQGQIDLVVMDIGMPGMGGHKCLRELLRIDPGAKVLVASGYAVNGQVKETLEAGAAGFVGKPYQVTELLDTVRKVLDGGQGS